DLGNAETAIKLFEEGLLLCREIGYAEIESVMLACMGRAYLTLDSAQAEAILRESQMLCLKLQSVEALAVSECYLGRYYHLCKNFPMAFLSYRDSVRRFNQINEVDYLPECLEGLGLAYIGLGEVTVATRLLGGAQKLREVMHTPIPPIDRDQ